MSGSAPAERPAAEPREPLCVPGRNCWCVVPATRVAFLVDADAYFSAVAATIARARKSILIVGWDIQAATRLGPGPMPHGWPATLREFLNAALAASPTLHAHVLDWDFSLLFALEREFLPVVQLGWLTHPRLTFRLDGRHPLTACHHQKIVVVDDAVAFVGGLDLTTHRWDTPAHRADDPDRRLPNRKPYGPFHDVQIAVSGEAARRLGALARERWRRATGERLLAVPAGRDPWPSALEPDLRHVDVAIARTEPAFESRAAVTEVERLYLDGIAAARRFLYVENQYFTSSRIAEALTARLVEPDGPEIVVVGPRTCSGWLEEQTMGTLRARLIRGLRAADRHGRLRVYHPRLPGESCVDLNVHSKVMIVDDLLVRVASSNLSNRSMGLDTECDVAIEACDDPRIAAAIAALRARLLAEHLGVSPDDVATAIAETGSLVAAIERLAGGRRTLVEFPDEAAEGLLPLLPELAPVDLERPVTHAPFLAWLLPPALREPVLHAVIRSGKAIAGIVCTTLVWQWLGLDGLFGTGDRAAPWLVGGYVLGTAAFVPTSALHTVTALVLGPRRGVLWAIAGATVAAMADFVAGRLVPRRRLAGVVGYYRDHVMRLLVPGRVRDVVAVRLAAGAPFAIAGLIAGTTGMRFWRFLFGTLAVVAPSAVATALLVWAME